MLILVFCARKVSILISLLLFLSRLHNAMLREVMLHGIVSDTEINAGDTIGTLARRGRLSGFEEAAIVHPDHVSTKFSICETEIR